MSTARFQDLERLTAGLTTVFYGKESTQENVVVLERRRNMYETTSPSEIVAIRSANGSKLWLFCKYGATQHDSVYGHRGNVAYEAEVYSKVLQPLQTSTPVFYGVYKDEETGASWLVLEYLENGMYVNQTYDSDAMNQAARWIGHFHATNEARLQRTPMTFLNTYDAEYYLAWVQRTKLGADRLHLRFPWLSQLCDSFEKLLPRFLSAPRTVIHGEYYPENVMYQNGKIRPVDWQTAAVAVGEIDLAALTQGWEEEVIQNCEREYGRSRWSEAIPNDFEQTLGFARLYMSFRWLGDPHVSIVPEDRLWYFEQLHSTGERLGFI